VFTATLLVLASSIAAAGEPIGRELAGSVQAVSTGFLGDTSGDRRLVILGAISGFMLVILVRLCFEFLRPSRRAENSKSREPMP
jgi:hypothetical protein